MGLYPSQLVQASVHPPCVFQMPPCAFHQPQGFDNDLATFTKKACNLTHDKASLVSFSLFLMPEKVSGFGKQLVSGSLETVWTMAISATHGLESLLGNWRTSLFTFVGHSESEES